MNIVPFVQGMWESCNRQKKKGFDTTNNPLYSFNMPLYDVALCVCMSVSDCAGVLFAKSNFSGRFSR